METTEVDQSWAQVRMKIGDHCLRNSGHKVAIENYQASLNQNPEKLDSLYRLARELAHAGICVDGLEQLKAVEHKKHFKCNLQECDCYYESNDFESNILVLNDYKSMIKDLKIDIPFNNKRIKTSLGEAIQKGPKMNELNRRFHTTMTNYYDTIGKNGGNCLLEQRKYFDKIHNRWRKFEKVIDTTPKIMKENNLCLDLIQEIVPNPLTPRENRHNELVRKIFTQSYMQSAWKDFDFLQKLRSNKTLLASTQNAASQEKIFKVIDECNATTSAMIKQLHARCPLYSKRQQTNLDSTRAQWLKEKKRCQLQKKIDFEMYCSLEKLKKYLKERNLPKLLKHAEHELVIRQRMYSTNLVPRRDEFTVDICNYIALGYIEDLLAKSELVDNNTPDDYDLLLQIFSLNFNKNKPVAYRFGDQSTFRDADKSASAKSEDKTFDIENRMKLKPMLKIELCYLIHEMCWKNLKQMRTKDARNNGKSVCEIAQGVSYLWNFLGHIMVCRADILNMNLQKVMKHLKEILDMIHIFKNDKLKQIFDKVMQITERLMLKQ
ncbi:hypothetical protein PVAND_002828 [Polypedilum vanderplanki]|uniref:Uncharacterized protein n=1 Tax=Polypedilum vanderplanki TaxID=319348 RepID=A0A9J6BSB6_POLVA|nr:hypothetical protein PVAND_002828 [Polypedilum vanderplanki]